MAVRRTLSTALFRTIESPLKDWIDHHPHPDQAASSRIAALEEQNAKLEKKLSMAMGAVQAATAQIVQLRTEVEAAANLAHQAMQKATAAQATAEAATEGVTTLETRHEPKAESKPKPAPRKPRKSG